MPRSTVKKSRLFREVSKLPERYVKHNYLKNLRCGTNEFLDVNPGPHQVVPAPDALLVRLRVFYD